MNALRSIKGMLLYKIDLFLILSARGQADYLASMCPNAVGDHVGLGGTYADVCALTVVFQGLILQKSNTDILFAILFILASIGVFITIWVA